MTARSTIGLLAILALLLQACSETRMLPQGQYLYDGSKIIIHAPDSISRKQKKGLHEQMEDLIRPRANSSLLGIRFKLLIYNAMGHTRSKGLRHWIQDKLGEPPVVASLSVFEKNRAVLQNRLQNRGFFQDTVKLDTTSKKRKIKSIYTAETGPQYTINKVTYPVDSTEVNKQIQKISKRSLLRPGDAYDLDMIKNERTRIDARLKQRGYYYFSPDYILALVDSTVGHQKVNIRVIVKKSTPLKAEEVYRINDVIVFADYDVQADTDWHALHPKIYEGYNIIDPEERFRPKIFGKALVFKPGDLYNRRDHDLSLGRLINLGVFKFVKVRFEEVDSVSKKLNAFYYLTPMEKKSIQFQVSGLTKSDDANGGLLSVTWRNRSLFKGAELFTLSFYGGLEKQFVSKGETINTSKLGVDMNLFVPRIIGLSFKGNSAFVPKTKINLGYEYFERSSQYTLNSFKTSFGYIWKESTIKEHQLNIITINYVRPSNITPEFQAQLDTNITLARSIERQFIIGPNYNFNVNTQLKPNHKKNNFYFNANVDLSSNVLGWVTGADIDKGKVVTILNTPFSQYVRGELDFRHYLSFSPTTTLASRATGGVGYAYGNSNVMPFIKEFFAGGANDIRAFRARSLGPGTYYAGNRATTFLPDQPGDVKLELNTELRFKLFSIFRWAFFADAGNVWTLREDTSRPGSKFTGQFLREMGVGVGTGIRLDISILIIRFDLGIPVREPYLPAGSRWVFDTKNMVWNFAIGYPF